jgi:oligopeptide/dipeptide ABC transporter ATP-binding protein
MRQRAIIASALSADPSLVIADEPTTALDATVEFQVLRLLARLRTERGMAMLLITHDLNVASWNCDRIHVLYAGRSMEEGSTQKIFERPRHPYTASLLAATPSIDRPPKVRARSDTAPAGGSDGCPFAGRCPNAQAVCSERFPRRSEASEGHRFWCHNPLQ